MTLIYGDCLNVECYPDSKADLILFDPPFPPKNNKKYKQIRENNKNDLKQIVCPDIDEFLDWWEKLLQILCNKIKSSGWIVFKMSDFGYGFLFDSTQKYFKFVSNVIWNKMRIKVNRYISQEHELLCVFRPTMHKNTYWKHKIHKNALKSAFHGGSKGKAFKSIINVPNYNSGTFGVSKHEHINQTPPELWRQFILYMCPEHGLILDPTMGTASVGVMAKQLNRTYWGIEIDQDSFFLAQKYYNRSKNATILSYMEGLK